MEWNVVIHLEEYRREIWDTNMDVKVCLPYPRRSSHQEKIGRKQKRQQEKCLEAGSKEFKESENGAI